MSCIGASFGYFSKKLRMELSSVSSDPSPVAPGYPNATGTNESANVRLPCCALYELPNWNWFRTFASSTMSPVLTEIHASSLAPALLYLQRLFSKPLASSPSKLVPMPGSVFTSTSWASRPQRCPLHMRSGS